jgi:hypothetical protein
MADRVYPPRGVGGLCLHLRQPQPRQGGRLIGVGVVAWLRSTRPDAALLDE